MTHLIKSFDDKYDEDGIPFGMLVRKSLARVRRAAQISPAAYKKALLRHAALRLYLLLGKKP